ncbi:phage tail tube protein [Streptomyces pseudogriseolus]|uniref:phage tail tube protein n=1 Tax=Streptomyces pseudogriseolus TaxID=36817 RepID=UPI003FA2360B
MAGLDAFGTQLERGDGAGTEVFTPIANVTNITPPGIERETYDVTAHDSPDGWREFIGGLKDGGEVEIELNYDPREHDVLVSDFEDSDPRNYRIVFPGTLGQWAFKAIMSGFESEAPHDDKLSATVTFKVSGKPTITAGT